MTEHAASGTDRRQSLLDRLRDDGGELETVDGRAVARSFGDPDREYRALAGAAAVVDDTDRTLIRVTDGRKEGRAHETLSGLLTNHFEAVEPDSAVYSFLLTAKGGPVAELRAIRREKEDWLDMPAACREGVLGHFEKYLPPLFADYRVDGSVGRLGVVGPRSSEALRPAVPETDLDELEPLQGRTARVAGVEALLLRRDAADAAGFDLYVPMDGAADVWSELDRRVREVEGRAAGRQAREIRRVELGLPVFGREIDRDTLPQETGQTDRAVSFDKGCYTGQEVVVRIEHRGQVNRHLRGLEFRPEALAGGLPETGAALYDGERERGTVTTAVRSPRLGPIGLGYVRREVEPGSLLALEPEGEPACRVRELPFES